ncbi:MAG: hypothetical protein ACI4NP_00160 [Thermoguttaceae bacterium]
MTKKNTSNIVSKDETVEERPWSLALRARVATISVASAGMLFCAVFWPSVLDFKQKIAGNALEDSGTVAGARVDEKGRGSDLSDSADRDSDWRSKLDALYPRGNFADERFPARENQRADYSDEDPTLRAARFNAFDSLAQDVAPSVEPYAELSDDDSELIAAAPFDDPLLDSPLPTVATSSSVASVAEPSNDGKSSLSRNDDFRYLASDVEPRFPELDSSPRQDWNDEIATSLISNQNALSVAPSDALARCVSEPLASLEPETSHADSFSTFQSAEQGFVSNYADVPASDDSYASFDDSQGDPLDFPAGSSVDAQLVDDSNFPTTNDEFAPLNDPVAPANDPLLSAPLPSNSSRVASTRYDAPVATSYDSAAEPIREEHVDSLAATAETPAQESVDATPAENKEPTVPRQSASEAALSPSYFSRAVGLYGGASNFTALYFARATELVGDSDAWSPETLSRFLPSPQTGVFQSDANQDVLPAPVNEPASAPSPTSESELIETSSSQTSLVGYIERERVGETKKTPIRSAAY